MILKRDDPMASTSGGFLTGVGVTLLLLSSMLAYACDTIYKPFYNEILSYEETIYTFYNFAHSPYFNNLPTEYRNFVKLVYMLDEVVKNYSEVYPELIEHKDEVEQLYTFTHSDEYDSLIASLEKISQDIENITRILTFLGYSDLANSLNKLPTLVSFMIEAKELSGTMVYLYSILEALPPEKLEQHVNMVKDIIELLPPDKLEEYLSQARSASEKAVDAINLVKKYPPKKIYQYSLLSVTTSTILCLTGLILIAKSKKKHY